MQTRLYSDSGLAMLRAGKKMLRVVNFKKLRLKHSGQNVSKVRKGGLPPPQVPLAHQ